MPKLWSSLSASTYIILLWSDLFRLLRFSFRPPSHALTIISSALVVIPAILPPSSAAVLGSSFWTDHLLFGILPLASLSPTPHHTLSSLSLFLRSFTVCINLLTQLPCLQLPKISDASHVCSPLFPQLLQCFLPCQPHTWEKLSTKFIKLSSYLLLNSSLKLLLPWSLLSIG